MESKAATERRALNPGLPGKGASRHTSPMDRATAIQQIRNACNALSAGVTGIHPLVPGLADQPTQDELFKALYELTKNIETVKKQLLKLERRDESAAL